MKVKNLCLLLFFAWGVSVFAQNSLTVNHLRCEYMTEPLGIDIPHPRMSWELVSNESNKKQKAYQILVSTDEQELARDRANMWDSKRVAGEHTNQIAYQGKPLKANTLYYWKVRVWDEKGKPTAWSSASRFFTGPGQQWNASWIGEKMEPIFPEDRYYPITGYRSSPAHSPDEKKWVLIDLGVPKTFDAIKIHPIDERTWVFPSRFTIEIALHADFSDARMLVKETEKDLKYGYDEFYYKKFSPAPTARYIRLNVEKLPESEREWKDKSKITWEFGLSEIELLHNMENVALQAKVIVSDTVEKLDHQYEARCLTDGYLKPTDKKNYVDNIPPSPLLRGEILVSKKVKHAFLSASAMGLYEAYINGKRVGSQQLAPEFTDYDQHLQYQTFEVTGLLVAGKNAVGVMLADGWYLGHRWSYPNRGGYGMFREFIGQLTVFYEDGSSEIFGTDSSWKMEPQGPVREASYFIGEVYDASYEQPGWNMPDFDASRWREVSAYPASIAPLCAQMNEPVAIIKEIKAKSVHKTGKNKYVFDLGQNIPGWVSISLPYNPGHPIRLRHGEELYEDGTLYTANLRAAKQIDIYKPAAKATRVTYEPRFTYHGFRYVEVEGLTQEPSPDCITGKVVASSSPVVSHFECSNKDINQLWSNIRWTLWGNLISIPTDCPQRDEREGWMADAQIFSQTAIYNLDMAAFYSKWERDIRDSQLEDGRFPDIAPHDGTQRWSFNGPGWADAGVIIPWQLYRNYNDTTVLSKSFEAMKKFVDFNYKSNPDLLWKKNKGWYGDWLNGNNIIAEDYPNRGGEVPDVIFSTAYFAYSTELTARAARILGKKAEDKYYSELATRIRDTFVKKFVSPEAIIEGNTQAGYAIALQFDLLPVALREKAAQHMVEAIKHYDNRISTGIHCTIFLMNQLVKYGYADIAYQLLTSHRFPSWLYSIDQGATTIWERWDGYVAGRGFQGRWMNSMNHVAIGAVGEWLYRHVLGIQLDQNKNAFENFVIAPKINKDIAWAKGNYHSINGNIAVAWKTHDGIFELDITVPANTEATVVLPVSGKKLKTGSGIYHYEEKLPVQ
ncbi:MAG: glycoside hydrolase family 78 protein [Bacteroidales bacterium]|jgi:alpha-L-rhamnosidase|nr:glycoside hydrolase family 78 protein [Bacteroidales bacterium]